MERFTERLPDGRTIVKNWHYTKVYNPKHGDFIEGEAVEKLARYEDLEEQKKLLELSRTVGDTVEDCFKDFQCLTNQDADEKEEKFTKHIVNSQTFTVDISDSGEFTINIQDCQNFTVNISDCKSYSINQQDSLTENPLPEPYKEV